MNPTAITYGTDPHADRASGRLHRDPQQQGPGLVRCRATSGNHTIRTGPDGVATLGLPEDYADKVETEPVIPSSLATVIAFLILVAPGILHESLYERRRPSHSTSAFREANRIALASVFLSGAALGILAVVRAVRPGLMPDPRELIADPQTYAQDHYDLIAAAIFVEVAIALALAWAWNRYRSRGQPPATIKPISAWFKVFREDAKGRYPYLRVVGKRLLTVAGHEWTALDPCAGQRKRRI